MEHQRFDTNFQSLKKYLGCLLKGARNLFFEGEFTEQILISSSSKTQTDLETCIAFECIERFFYQYIFQGPGTE